jgi:hypothetical protein
MATDVKFDVELRDGHRPLADDEPVFVFRAQDKAFPSVLSYYASLCETFGSPPEHIEAILRHREAALRWQAQNGCSVPD